MEITGEIKQAVTRAARSATRKVANLIEPNTAEDVAQEIYIQLLRRYDADKGDVGAFIGSMARQITIDMVRKRHGRHEGSRVSFAELPDNLSFGNGAIDEVDTATSLDWLLKNETPKVRSIMQEYVLGQATMAEIAYRHDLTESRICQIIGEVQQRHRRDRRDLIIRSASAPGSNTANKQGESDMGFAKMSCSNCERPDMACRKIGELMLCGSCCKAISGVPKEEQSAALAAAKARLAGQPKMRAGCKRGSDGAGIAGVRGARRPAAEERAPKSGMSQIIITFSERTMGLYNRLLADAERDFRSPDQQVLWMISRMEADEGHQS